MRLVNREEGERETAECLQPVAAEQPLRGDVEQVDLATAERALHLLLLLEIQAGVPRRGAQAQLPQRPHLIFHQRDERADNHAEPGTEQ